jgi:hypothetical protein
MNLLTTTNMLYICSVNPKRKMNFTINTNWWWLRELIDP